MYLMMPRGRGCWPRPPKQYQLILRAKLRRSQRRHRDLGNVKAICRVERVCGSVGDFLLTVGSRVDAIEADVLPEWSRASEEGVETEMTFGRNELGERPIEIEVRPGVSRRLRRDVRVHLTNQIVDKRSVGRSENEIRGAWIIGAAEVVRLGGASESSQNFSERVDQIRVALTISVNDDAERLKRRCLQIEVVARIHAHETGN